MGYGKQGIEIKDSLTLSVPWHADLIVKEQDGMVISVTPPELPEMSIGTKVKVNNEPYKVNMINKVGKGQRPEYHLSIAQRTKASLFILPMMPQPKNFYLTGTRLLNAFVRTPEHDNVIALLYRFSGQKTFLGMESSIRHTPGFISAEDMTSSTVLYTLNVPDRFMEDYTLFLQGSYSRMSEAYKERILRFHEMGPSSAIGQILYKSEDRKKSLEEMLETRLPPDAEVFSSPDLDKETYDPLIYDL